MIKYDRNEIIIQSPICKLEYLGQCNNLFSMLFKLSDNFEYFQFFCSLHELIIKNLCRYADNSEYEIMKKYDSKDQEHIRKSFRSHVVKTNDIDMIISLKINENTKFFNKEKEEITVKDIKKGDYVVCIMKSNKIELSEEYFLHTWDCIQCLKWKSDKISLNTENTDS